MMKSMIAVFVAVFVFSTDVSCAEPRLYPSTQQQDVDESTVTPVILAEENQELAGGLLSIRVVDKASGEPMACRITVERPRSGEEDRFVFGHQATSSGRFVKPPKWPYFGDHFVCEGAIERLRLAETGRYRYRVSHGKEYRGVAGEVELQAGQHQTIRVELERLTDLSAHGWFSGDLHNHRGAAHMPLLLRAEDLYIVPVPEIWYHDRQRVRDWQATAWDSTQTQHTSDGRCYPPSIEEEQQNCLFYFNVTSLPNGKRLHPWSTCTIATTLQQGGVWLDIDRPTWWDVPVILANARLDSIGLINCHFTRNAVLARGNPGWSYMRDTKQYPGAKGYADWNFDVYCHILNCGFRIPPSAGSASGVLNNPVGQNRMYVHCGDRFEYSAWWEGLRAGRVFVTNGPALVPSVRGQRPGFVFQGAADQSLDLDLEIDMVSEEVVSHIEVVKNGAILEQVAINDVRKQGKIAMISFSSSGWFLLRAVCDTEAQRYVCAITAPYYVEIGGSPKRISQRAARYFLKWLQAAEEQDAARRWTAKELHRSMAYFEALRHSANAP